MQLAGSHCGSHLVASPSAMFKRRHAPDSEAGAELTSVDVAPSQPPPTFRRGTAGGWMTSQHLHRRKEPQGRPVRFFWMLGGAVTLFGLGLLYLLLLLLLGGSSPRSTADSISEKDISAISEYLQAHTEVMLEDLDRQQTQSCELHTVSDGDGLSDAPHFSCSYKASIVLEDVRAVSATVKLVLRDRKFGYTDDVLLQLPLLEAIPFRKDNWKQCIYVHKGLFLGPRAGCVVLETVKTVEAAFTTNTTAAHPRSRSLQFTRTPPAAAADHVTQSKPPVIGPLRVERRLHTHLMGRQIKLKADVAAADSGTMPIEDLDPIAVDINIKLRPLHMSARTLPGPIGPGSRGPRRDLDG